MSSHYQRCHPLLPPPPISFWAIPFHTQTFYRFLSCSHVLCPSCQHISFPLQQNSFKELAMFTVYSFSPSYIHLSKSFYPITPLNQPLSRSLLNSTLPYQQPSLSSTPTCLRSTWWRRKKLLLLETLLLLSLASSSWIMSLIPLLGLLFSLPYCGWPEAQSLHLFFINIHSMFHKDHHRLTASKFIFQTWVLLLNPRSEYLNWLFHLHVMSNGHFQLNRS